MWSSPASKYLLSTFCVPEIALAQNSANYGPRAKPTTCACTAGGKEGLLHF